jgi:tRNA modification GTPase
LKEPLVELIALLEAGIDFAEDDVSVAPAEEILRRLAPIVQGTRQLAESFQYGGLVRQGLTLAIVGRPNVGKSSLFNRLLEQDRAIVTEIPGTTRDAIEAPTVIEGFPFRLVDTAGLRDSGDRLERLGIEVSQRYLGAADLILYCEAFGDVGRGTRDGALMEATRAPVIDVVTKIDLVPAPRPASPIPGVSTVTGEGLADLRRQLAQTAFGKLVSLGDVEPVVTRARHRDALQRALAELEAFRDARAGGVDAAATATHLRAAVGALDDLIGAITPDDVLDRVFATFCVGK